MSEGLPGWAAWHLSCDVLALPCTCIPLSAAASPPAALQCNCCRQYAGEEPGLPRPLDEPEHCFNTYYKEVRQATRAGWRPGPATAAQGGCIRDSPCVPAAGVLTATSHATYCRRAQRRCLRTSGAGCSDMA